MPKTKRRRSQGHSTPYGLKPGEYRLVYSHIYTYDNNCQSLGQKELETLNRNSQGLSLLFLFDLEATGLSVYTDCITEIAGKVFDPPVDVKQATFSSLVHTDHHIPKIGTTHRLSCLHKRKYLLYLLLNQEAIAYIQLYSLVFTQSCTGQPQYRQHCHHTVD